MASLPGEVLLGIYLGLLVGIIPALASWGLGFAFKYFTGVTLPGFGVTILAVALAGVNGGLLALADQTITRGPNAVRIVTAIVVVAMMAMYAHSRGDRMGAEMPHRVSISALRDRSISVDLADFVTGHGEVRVRVVGEVADMEGYPPLSEELRAEVRNAELTFPVDLPLSEIEERMAERLEAEFDLGAASVSIDERGRATVVAAPPFSGLSKRVGADRHAVSVDGLVPTGLARGDEVTLITPDAQARGEVVSARTDGGGPTLTEPPDEVPIAEDAADPDVTHPPKPIRAPTTDGGEGRVTAAVTRTDVQPLLRADAAKIVVESRGTRREYEVISLLRRANRRLRRVTVASTSQVAGSTVAGASLRERHGLTVLAVRTAEGWQVAPDGTTTLEPGADLLVTGTEDALEAAGGVFQ